MLRPVPVVPLVQGDGDLLAGQGRDLLAVLAMGLGNAAHVVGCLAHVGQQVRLLAHVEMLADHVHGVSGVGHHALRPRAHGAHGHDLDRGIDGPHRLGELPVFLDVLLQRHVTKLPVAVHLVADRPPAHAIGLGVAVLGAQFAHRRVHAAVGVLDHVHGQLHVALAAVDDHVRLRVDFPTELHELVDAEIVVLDALPGRVLAGRAAVGVPDAVLPVVAAHEIPARPAVDRRIQLLQELQRVGPHAVHVVLRHERDRADAEAAAAPDNLQTPVVRVGLGRELQRKHTELRRELRDADHAAVTGARSPNQADGDFLGRRSGGNLRAGQPDAPDVALAFAQRQSALPDACLDLLVGQGDLGRVLPDEWFRALHLAHLGPHHGLPGRLLVIHRVEELAVFEHLGPDPAVDAAAQVLDELAVDILRDRCPLLRGVDADGHLGLGA